MNKLFNLSLTLAQRKIVSRPLSGRVFLEGPAGCGKTTSGVMRLLGLIEGGVPGRSILLLVPQRALAEPYQQTLLESGLQVGSMVTIVTVGGLARRMIDLFWPLIAEEAGFSHPDKPPLFLTLETAQYHLARLVRPLLGQGYFESVVMVRNRIYSQIIDNLNKAALTGFPYQEIAERLKAAWLGGDSQTRVYDDAQECATRFRQYCLNHNLLDFSLQIEVFRKHLWEHPHCRQYLRNTYRHLIADNLEEDFPVAHDLLREWLGDFESVLLIYDQEAGYRRFLGADAEYGYTLADLCDERVEMKVSFVTPPTLHAFSVRLGKILNQFPRLGKGPRLGKDSNDFIQVNHSRFYPTMLDWAAEQVAHLLYHDGVPADEIVILMPFLSDALRFSLVERLSRRGVPVRTHRPSRSLRDEPITSSVLTLVALAHPHWGVTLQRDDFTYAVMQVIEDLDFVRARLLSEVVFRLQGGRPTLTSFDAIKAEMQERITYRVGERYENLRRWLEVYQQGSEEAMDFFCSRLFGEVLSQPGYRFHANFWAGEVVANLIESMRKFRQVMGNVDEEDNMILGKEYIEMVRDGVIAAQYLRSWRVQPDDAVLVSPAYTFLLRNRAVDYQIWLDIGGRGWYERLVQPLTQPYVLSRGWPRDKVWSDADEIETSQRNLYRLVTGLIRRCRRRIYLGYNELNEQGYENRGLLLRAIDRVFYESFNLGQ